jgi:hypothetical protein
VPAWTVMATLEVYRYCFPPLGQTLYLFALVGAVVLWRQGRRDLVAFLVVPVVLALIAAFLHRYPYGGARVMVYAAPALIVLIGAGLAPVMGWMRQRGRIPAAVCLSLFLLPGVQAIHRVINPWERAETGQASSFVLNQCEPSDLILGNNWTHVYYFHDRGPRFHHFEGFATDAREARRAWILYTSQTENEQRVREAMSAVPSGWKVLEHREFRFTTVLLAVDPGARRDNY